jgi:hypothetical protein
MRERLRGRFAPRAVAYVFVVLLLAACTNADIERQMQTLCKQDGGVRVFESVVLPSSYYENTGAVHTHSAMPTGRTDGSWFSRIGDDEYRVIHTQTYIVGKKPMGYVSDESLVRSHTGIYKWPEKRLLGEEVIYYHGYGSRFSFGFQPGLSHCPTNRENLVAGVFRKE